VTPLALTDPDALVSLGVAFAVGLAVGLQRERVYAVQGRPGPAGARTFPIVALLGGLTMLAGDVAGPVLAGAGFLGLSCLAVAAYRRGGKDGVGITTEVLVLLTYVLGAVAVAGHRETAAIVGAAAVILVALKKGLHGFAGRLTDEDEVATLKFVAVALLALPFLPDREFGPYGAFNPHDIGLMVVLVAGVSFAGYVAVKAVGAERGLLITGLLGGLVSTTATTAAFARRSKKDPTLSAWLAAGTIAAQGVLFPRVLVLAITIDPDFGPTLWPYLAAMAAVSIVVAGIGVALQRRTKAQGHVEFKNPFEVAPALWFAAVYAVVVLVARVANARFGTAGLYATGALSGTTDMDAITLTAARLHRAGTDPVVLARTVTIAAIANGVVKTIIAFVLGTRAFAVRVGAALFLAMLAGLASILLF
jgi:uncharacterized membrane protein (DUF4010 family)